MPQSLLLFTLITTKMIGEFEVKLTEKNRLALPKKFRSSLKDQLILSRGYEGCLILMDQARWRSLIKSIRTNPILERNVRASLRFILGGAQEIELDSQGRFVLSQSHKDYASIIENVIFIGLEDWIEVWDANTWSEYLSGLSESSADIAQRLIEINNDKA